MDTDSAARIVRANLAGEAAVPRYLEKRADTARVLDGDIQDTAVTRTLPPVLSDGAEIRRRDAQRLSDLERSFDEIERQATELANWVASLIETAGADART